MMSSVLCAILLAHAIFLCYSYTYQCFQMTNERAPKTRFTLD